MPYNGKNIPKNAGMSGLEHQSGGGDHGEILPDMKRSRAFRSRRTKVGVTLIPESIDVVAPKAGEVRLRVTAASLNFRDLLVADGVASGHAEERIPLSDCAGIVEEVGDGVALTPGDRVTASFFPDWISGPFQAEYLTTVLGGTATDGVLAQSIVLPAQALVRVPESLTDLEAATIPCAAVTAWHGLIVRAGMTCNDTVLIQGTGGVALFALQFAIAVGASPIVLSSSDEKLDRARALGAKHLINYTTRPDWHHDVIAVNGSGASVVLELGGAATYDQSIRSLAPSGRLVQVGVLTGFGQRPDLSRVQSVNATIHGISVGSRGHLAETLAFMDREGILPVIDRVFSLEEVNAAYKYMRTARHFGKIVIDLTK